MLSEKYGRGVSSSRFLHGLLLCSLLAVCTLYASACSAEQPQYTITAAELESLESNLMQLEEANNSNNKELNRLLKALAASEGQTQTLQQQLITLQQDSEQQQKLLQTANAYLQQYEQEQNSRVRIIKRQRTFAYILAGCLLVALVREV